MTVGAWIWMVVWVAALLVMVWLLVDGGQRTPHENPLDVLRHRYAAGEISEEEFRHARDILGTGEEQR